MELNAADSADRALHRALREALRPPVLPTDFRAQLRRQLVMQSASMQQQVVLQQEWQCTQARLRAESVQLRWQTLLWLLGGAFAAGAVTMAVMPWVASHYGARWSYGVPVAVATLGLVASWVGDPRVRRLLAQSGFFGA
ncbi:MAG: hypothetical protein WCP04_06030 [Pseudomonadota bacterium]|jgi:hypothetical protein